MLPPGHIAGGYLAARLAGVIYPELNNVNFFVLTTFFGFFPDLDFFFAFFKVRKMITRDDVNHRTFPTHAPLLYLLVFGIWYIVFSETRLIAWAFIIGTCSHFLIDTFAAEGIQWLYPISKKLYGKSFDPRIIIIEQSFFKHWLQFMKAYLTVFSFKAEVILIIIALIIFYNA